MMKGRKNNLAGVIGYNATTGLGIIISWFKRFLLIDSHFIIKHPTIGYGDLYTLNNIFISKECSDKEMREYIESFNVKTVFIIETPFNFNYFKILKENNIKTIFMPMLDTLSINVILPYKKYIDIVICPTKICYERYKKWFLNKAIYLPYPIDTEYFNPKNIEYKNKYFFLHNQGNGGAHWRKGSEQVYKAFKLMQHLCENASLWINRQPTLDPIYHLTQNVDNLNINVMNFSNQIDIYKQGVIYLAPSKREGIGLPIIEAMSCGLPVITTNAPPMNEWITNKDMLISVKKKILWHTGDTYGYIPDVDDIVNKMVLIYNNSNIKNNNREIVEENFSWNKLKDKYLSLL